MLFSVAQLEGTISAELLEAMMEEIDERVFSNAEEIIQPVYDLIQEPELMSARDFWARCNAEADHHMYMDVSVLGDDFRFILFVHPENQFMRFGTLMHGVRPETAVNDMLMGCAGSSTLLHVDVPVPYEACFLVIEGGKEVIAMKIRPEDIPADIRTHAVGTPGYTELEWANLVAWHGTLPAANRKRWMLEAGKCGMCFATLRFHVCRKVWCCIVGDMAHIPLGWWHAAYNILPTISVNQTLLFVRTLPSVSLLLCLMTC